jgi:class 3 adenylate cyclase
MATRQSSKKKRPTLSVEALQRQQLHALNRVLSFGPFLACSFEPAISDVEIVACFSDLRGFTHYCSKLQQDMQDRKIQNFLRDYVKVFNEGLVAWTTMWADPASKDYDESVAVVAKHLVPTTYKNLGDGMMLVWEIPPNLDIHSQGIIAMQTLFLLQDIQDRFLKRFRNLSPPERDAYSDDVLNLSMGFGVAKGHAWKLDFGNHVDYAGSVLNLAARLQELARPSGLVVHTDVATWLLESYEKDGRGKSLLVKDLKGFKGEVPVWVDRDVDTTAEWFKPSKKVRRR